MLAHQTHWPFSVPMLGDHPAKFFVFGFLPVTSLDGDSLFLLTRHNIVNHSCCHPCINPKADSFVIGSKKCHSLRFPLANLLHTLCKSIRSVLIELDDFQNDAALWARFCEFFVVKLCASIDSQSSRPYIKYAFA